MSYQTVGVSGFTSSNKIPEYAREYKREYQFIRGINNDFKYLINKLDNSNKSLYDSKLTYRIKFNMKRFLKGQEKGKLKDISEFVLPFDEIDNIYSINDYFTSYKLQWDSFDKKHYPDFIDLYNTFKLIYVQINCEDLNDSDSDQYFDIGEFCEIMNSFCVIESDSDDDF